MAQPTLEELVERVSKDLGARDRWVVPKLYRESLALAVIDSIQSIGVRYGSVVTVLDNYRDFRRERNAEPNADGASELVGTFDELGGSDEWAATIGNRHKTSTAPGAPLKAQVIEQAARGLLAQQIDTAQQFREQLAGDERESELKRWWLALPGQRSGISWGYVTALVGLPSVKPDRMIVRYFADAMGNERLTPLEAGSLLKQVAGALQEDPFLVDHNLWRLQSGRAETVAGSATS